MGIFLNMLIALSLGLVAPTASADNGEIQILDPWVQAAPPNVKVLAAYLEIKNNGGKPRILVDVSSPSFDQVGIHRSVMHGDMVHMEHLKELAIPPHDSVTLKPGGLHLMMMDAKNPLHAGDSVPMTLTFKNGDKVAVQATVRASQMEGMGDTPQMDHSKHMDHSEHMKHNH